MHAFHNNVYYIFVTCWGKDIDEGAALKLRNFVMVWKLYTTFFVVVPEFRADINSNNNDSKIMYLTIIQLEFLVNHRYT